MYKGQTVEMNYGVSAERPENTRSKLDMRFADEEDAGDIECVLQISDACEFDENSHFYCRMPNNQIPGARSKLNVRVGISEIIEDCCSTNARWIVMETAAPEEQVLGAARLLLGGAVDGVKRAVVNVFACVPDTRQQSVRSQLLAQLERIAVGQGADLLVIEVIQHRIDVQEWLEACDYSELGGRICEEPGLLKPTMIFEFHKNLRQAVSNAEKADAAFRAKTSCTATIGLNRESPRATTVPQVMSFVRETHAPDSESSDFNFDLASLSLDEVEIVSYDQLGANEPHGVQTASAPSADPMRNMISDLFHALHKEKNMGL